MDRVYCAREERGSFPLSFSQSRNDEEFTSANGELNRGGLAHASEITMRLQCCYASANSIISQLSHSYSLYSLSTALTIDGILIGSGTRTLITLCTRDMICVIIISYVYS